MRVTNLLARELYSVGRLKVSGWKPKAAFPNLCCMTLKFFHS